MDNLGWDTNPATFRNSEIAIPPTNLWSSNHYVDNFSESELDYSIIASNKVELNGGYLLNSNVIELQQDSVSLQRLNEMAEILAAAPTTFDYYSTNNNTLDLGFLHQEEATVRLASNSAAYFSTTPSSIPDQVLLHALEPLENLGHESQEQEILAPQNLSNSGSLSSSGESEAAVNSHSHSIKTMRGNSKRKLEDQQHSCNLGGIFQIFFDKSSPNSKRPNLAKTTNKSSNIDFRQESKEYEPDTEAIAQVKEMIYRAAALRPMNLVLAEQVAEKPKRKNVRISSDPQTVAARHRRERISERLRVLQMLVPGGAKMDTASMLDEAANYLKFLKSQLTALETLATSTSKPSSSNSFACFQ